LFSPSPAALDAKLLAICNVAGNVRTAGPFVEQSPYFAAAEFLDVPQAVVAGVQGINGALVGHIEEGTVICVRGTFGFNDPTRTLTQRFLDWTQDGEALLGEWIPGAGLCHVGFTSAVDSLLSSPAMPPLQADREVIFCGHSKGGACAVLMALRYWLDTGRPATCVTFGAPRAGGTAFAAAFGNSRVTLRRYENAGDVVPHVPFEPRMAEALATWIGHPLPAADFRSVGSLQFIDTRGAIHRPASLWEEMTVDAGAAGDLFVTTAIGGVQSIIRRHSIEAGGDYCSAVAPRLKAA
jgi:hypothetical protein